MGWKGWGRAGAVGAVRHFGLDALEEAGKGGHAFFGWLDDEVGAICARDPIYREPFGLGAVRVESEGGEDFEVAGGGAPGDEGGSRHPEGLSDRQLREALLGEVPSAHLVEGTLERFGHSL